MGKRISLRIINQEKEKIIKVREGITINNLKAVIERVMLQKMEKIEIVQEGREITGHWKLSELGLEEGYTIESNGSEN